jgi:hypothetical protein
MAKDKVFSINALSETLERDRRTVKRALEAFPPDGRDAQGRPGWKISTAARALTLHAEGRDTSDSDRAWLPVEQADAAVRDALERLEAIPDLEERRALARKERVPVRALEDALLRFVEQGAFRPGQQQLFREYVIPRLVNDALSEFLAVCNWQIRFDEQRPAA